MSELRTTGRRVLIVGVNLLIALLHIVGPGACLSSQARALYHSYFSDLLLPFGLYLLLCASGERTPALGRWQARLALAFGLPALAETLQYVGIWALGVTFDPLDYVMYATGAAAAALFDRQVLYRHWPLWRAADGA